MTSASKRVNNEFDSNVLLRIFQKENGGGKNLGEDFCHDLVDKALNAKVFGQDRQDSQDFFVTDNVAANEYIQHLVDHVHPV